MVESCWWERSSPPRSPPPLTLAGTSGWSLILPSRTCPRLVHKLYLLLFPPPTPSLIYVPLHPPPPHSPPTPPHPHTQAARLCLQVVGGARAKEVKRKSLSLKGRRSTREDKKDQVDKPLHWVNMQILDHRYVCMLLLPLSHHHIITPSHLTPSHMHNTPSHLHTIIPSHLHTITHAHTHTEHSSTRVYSDSICGPFSQTPTVPRAQWHPWVLLPSTQMETTRLCSTLNWTPTLTQWPAPQAGGGRVHLRKL